MRFEAASSSAFGLTAEPEHIAVHLDRIDAVREDGREIEIEFTATGYPGRYVKRLSLDGPAGVHQCRHVP
ncbi:hypothetical protein [Sorangium sp. So ce176]|uniref:hypothetical protein n=1 Tax=Sorangium sp. So ce176 TaxID=3133286 RepID=UPI003F5EC8F6